MKLSEHIEKDLQLILRAMEKMQDWEASLTIQKAAGLQEMEQRNFQRRLQNLLKQNIVKRTGDRKGTRYLLHQPPIKPTTQQSIVQPIIDGVTTDVIPFSITVQEIAAIVIRPENERNVIGYNREWVMSYQPNQTFYLNQRERDHLRAIGVTITAGQPAGTYARQILQRLLIDLSWNSSRLEGNTYSLLDTQQLLVDGKVADKKNPADAQMIINHKEAIEFIVDNAEETGMNPYTIRNLHGILSYNLLPDPGAPGRVRQFGVGIGNSVYTSLALGAQIEEMFERVLKIADAITDPFEQAFFVMVQLPYLQPFEDVNKPVSRLAANIPLNRANLIPLSFIDVPKEAYIQGLLGVYELIDVTLLKEVFIRAYERSVKRYAMAQLTLGEPDPFRLRHTVLIKQVIGHIISKNLSKQDANTYIDEKAQELPMKDRSRFNESVSQNLLSLHSGNFARYKVTPNIFHTWQKHWGLEIND